jgi:hypothetical protein
MKEATPRKRPPLMLQISLPTANWLYDLSNLSQILGAALVLMGTFGAVWSGHVRDGYADRERQQLEAKIVPRHLSDEQRDSLLQKLSSTKWKSAEILWHGTGEPESYARNLALVFEQAKIQTHVHTLGPFIPSAWGLIIVITENDDSAKLKAILDEVGVPSVLAETNDTLGKKDHPTILVGARED